MKLLVVLPRFPYPLDKGDKLRAFHQIKQLSANNDIYLFALSHDNVPPDAIRQMQPYCKDIRIAKLSKLAAAARALCSLLCRRSLQIGYWSSSRAIRQCLDFEALVRPDVAYLQMVRTLPLGLRLASPKVLDFQDALSMNLQRRMAGHNALRLFVENFEFKMLRSAEYDACSSFNGLTIISEVDAEALPQPRGTHINIVRNGVDFDFFHPQAIEKRYDIVFCGNMQYNPNIDASRFLVDEVMPLVWRSRPEASVCLAGATPTAAVRRLSGPHVTVTGSVPDIRPYYAQSRLFIAPMRLGSGLQNKLLEAMAMGIPCITTPLANAALGATPDTHLLLGNNPAQLAQAILRLLDDEQLRSRLAANASAFVHQNFSWQAATKPLETILLNAKKQVEIR